MVEKKMREKYTWQKNGGKKKDIEIQGGKMAGKREELLICTVFCNPDIARKKT